MAAQDRFRQRLHTQHIAGPGLATPESVVQLLGAVQSQDYSGAKWSLGQRVVNGTNAAIDAAFASGRILRTHILRPTWHFVAPEDIRWMLRLTAPRVHALNAFYYRSQELDDAVFTRCHRTISLALQGGNHLTRLELAARLRAAGIVADKLRLAYVMMHAELEGLVCSGPLRGKQHTYALLEERVPPQPTLSRDEALAALVRRFFTGHAPATAKHFVWWSGLTVADANAGLRMVEQELSRDVSDDGTEWFGGPKTVPRRGPMAAYLIPEYDEALVGGKDLGVSDIPRSRQKRQWKDTFFRPIIIDGQRAGTWRRSIARGEGRIETNLLGKLDRDQEKALDAAANRFGIFLGMPVRVV
jgi:hypothetical protein